MQAEAILLKYSKDIILLFQYLASNSEYPTVHFKDFRKFMAEFEITDDALNLTTAENLFKTVIKRPDNFE